jgi:hypothetical protein
MPFHFQEARVCLLQCLANEPYRIKFKTTNKSLDNEALSNNHFSKSPFMIDKNCHDHHL